MSDLNADVVVVKGKGYLKWSDEMEALLVKSVKVNKAHIKTKKLQFQEKYDKVIADLWSRKVFFEQCEKQTWTTVQKIFRALCDKFRSTHGYGDSGMRVNLSALPDMDDLSEINELLHDMCKEIASQIEVTDHEKKAKSEKKKVVMDITDVIQSGGGKSGLAKLAGDMKNSGEDYLSAKTDNFVKGLFETSGSSRRKVSETGGDSKGNVASVTSAVKGSIVSTVTGESSVRKRKISRSEIEGEDLMRTFTDQFRREDQAEESRMAHLEETIRVTGEATAAAIAAGNEETARSNRALFNMLSSLLENR
jgi:hypothetical protein